MFLARHVAKRSLGLFLCRSSRSRAAAQGLAAAKPTGVADRIDDHRPARNSHNTNTIDPVPARDDGRSHTYIDGRPQSVAHSQSHSDDTTYYLVPKDDEEVQAAAAAGGGAEDDDELLHEDDFMEYEPYPNPPTSFPPGSLLAPISDRHDLHFKGTDEHRLTLSAVVSFLRTQKASNIVALNADRKSNDTDFMVFATGKSARHLSALSRELFEMGVRHNIQYGNETRIEGADGEEWIVVDTGNIEVHLQTELQRARYALDRKWALSDLEDLQYDREMDLHHQDEAAEVEELDPTPDVDDPPEEDAELREWREHHAQGVAEGLYDVPSGNEQDSQLSNLLPGDEDFVLPGMTPAQTQKYLENLEPPEPVHPEGLGSLQFVKSSVKLPSNTPPSAANSSSSSSSSSSSKRQ